MLNGLWLSFFLLGAIAALARWLIGGDAAVFGAMVESLFAFKRAGASGVLTYFALETARLLNA